MKNRVAVILPRVIAHTYGASVAYGQWIHGIIDHATFNGQDLFCHPGDLARVTDEYGTASTVKVYPHEALVRNLRRHQYEVIVCRGLSSVAGMCAVRDLAGGGRPPVCGITATLSYYGCLIDMFHGMLVCNPRFDHFFCGTKAARKVMENLIAQLREAPGVPNPALSAANLVLIPHGLDAGPFSALPEKAACRERFKIPADECVILSVGRLSFYDKIDYETLVSAFAILKRLCGARKLRLVVAGDNRDRGAKRIVELAGQHGVAPWVTVVPTFRREEKPLLYGASDVFVSLSNSVQESFGLTLLEAMASGLPIVATNWNGYREIVRDGCHGYLVNTRWKGNLKAVGDASPILAVEESHKLMAGAVVIDPAEVANKIKALLDDQGARARMADEARKRAAEFAWPAIIKRAETQWRSTFRKACDQISPPTVPRWLFLDYRKTFGHYPRAGR